MNGTGGGVLHLLRLTRTQCNASIAFVALRSESGTIDLTVVPSVDEGSEWTLDTLHGIVRQTLEDPLIGEGRAVIRVSEVFRRYWPGERQYTRMAVAPLNDVTDPQHPWGLLCALDPVSGQFDEAQLDMLGLLAIRFMNHLRARKKVMEELQAGSPESPAGAAPVGAPADLQAPGAAEAAAAGAESPAGDELLTASPLRSESEGELAEGGAAQGAAVPPSAGEQEAATTEAARQDEAARSATAAQGAEAAAGVGADEGGMVGGGTGEALSADVAEGAMSESNYEEWTVYDYSAGAQVGGATPPTEPGAAPAAGGFTPAGEAGQTEQAAGVAGGAPEHLRLGELVERLDTTLRGVEESKRPGALLLVELPTAVDEGSAATDEEIASACSSVSDVSRHDDSVVRVGTGMIAVTLTLRPGPTDLSRIKERLGGAASSGLAVHGRQLQVRSALVRMEPGLKLSGEDLVFAAVRQLGTA